MGGKCQHLCGSPEISLGWQGHLFTSAARTVLLKAAGWLEGEKGVSEKQSSKKTPGDRADTGGQKTLRSLKLDGGLIDFEFLTV